MQITAAAVATARAAQAVVLILSLIAGGLELGFGQVLFHQFGDVFAHNVELEIDR